LQLTLFIARTGGKFGQCLEALSQIRRQRFACLRRRVDVFFVTNHMTTVTNANDIPTASMDLAEQEEGSANEKSS